MNTNDSGAPAPVSSPDVSNLVISGTGDGLIAFLQYVQSKGYMTAPTASALRTGCTKVLEAVPELRTTDLRNIDMDERIFQFRNKSKGKYADKTLETYRKRFEQSVSMYCKWLVDDKDWLTVRPRQRSVSSQARQVTPVVPSSVQPAQTSARAVDQHQRESPMVTYPLPLRSGVKATLILPEDLTDREAARVSQFVKALAFGNPAADTPWEGDERT